MTNFGFVCDTRLVEANPSIYYIATSKEKRRDRGEREKNSSLLNLYDKNCDLQQDSVLYGRKWKLQKYRERVARAYSSAGCLSYREASSRLNFHFSVLRCGIRQFSDSARYSSLATNLSCLLDRKSVGE